jgi:Tol biopolymer transport system component
MGRIAIAAGIAAAALVAAFTSGSRASTPVLKRNGLIAFASDRGVDRGGEIYSVGVSGGMKKNLTRNPGGDADPVVSRDGTHIAFFSRRMGSWSSPSWQPLP